MHGETIKPSKFNHKLPSISQVSTNPTVNIRNSKNHKTCRTVELKLPTQQGAIQELKTCRASEEFSVLKLWPTQTKGNSRNHKPAGEVNSSLRTKKSLNNSATWNSRTAFATLWSSQTRFDECVSSLRAFPDKRTIKYKTKEMNRRNEAAGETN